MAFNGIFIAPNIEPLEFGLFSVAKPNSGKDSKTEDQWTRGFYQLYDTLPNFVRNWSETSVSSYVVSDDENSATYKEVKPIFVEVEDYRSTFSVTGEDRFERILKQLEGVSQKALENEMWDGEIAQAESLPNTYLTSTTGTIIYPAAAVNTAYSPTRALALLEQYSGSSSPSGESGVIHMTRDVFTTISAGGGVFVFDKDEKCVKTATGAKVIVGSGYTGSGPHRAIATIAIASNVATITTTGNHHLKVGETVKITSTGGVTTFNGSYAVATVTSNTAFTASITAANQGATAYAGHVQMVGNDDTKWIYATVKVQAHLGKSEVVNDTLAQGYDVSGNQNDLRIKATRSAAVYFDPSIHLGIKIDLTAQN